MTGLEPANGGTTNHCLNHLATPACINTIHLIIIHNNPYSIKVYVEYLRVLVTRIDFLTSSRIKLKTLILVN